MAKKRTTKKTVAKKSTKPVSKVAKTSTRKAATKKAAPKKKVVSKRAKVVKKATPKKTPAPKRVAVKKQAKTVKRTAQPKGPKGYTPDEYKKFLEQKNKLKQMSNQTLKDMLRKNRQSMSGNKDDLVLKVADGIVLGSIPKCPGCYGGRPRYDYKTGIYTCPGYREDEDYINCHRTYTRETFKRDPWE